MTVTLPAFPLDEITLNLIDEALNASYDSTDEDGDPHLVGADFTLPRLLEFLAGYQPVSDGAVAVSYSPHDLIRALVHEVRHLRKETTR